MGHTVPSFERGGTLAILSRLMQCRGSRRPPFQALIARDKEKNWGIRRGGGGQEGWDGGPQWPRRTLGVPLGSSGLLTDVEEDDLYARHGVVSVGHGNPSRHTELPDCRVNSVVVSPAVAKALNSRPEDVARGETVCLDRR